MWEYRTILPASWETCMQVKKKPARNGTTDWFQSVYWQYIGNIQDCILSPCLFSWYAGYIMQNARLDESWAGIMIARRNVNNLRCVNDTPLMAEGIEELKSLFMKVKEESEKAGLKQHSINEDHGICSHHSHHMTNKWGYNGNNNRLYYLWLQNHCRWWLQPWN